MSPSLKAGQGAPGATQRKPHEAIQRKPQKPATGTIVGTTRSRRRLQCSREEPASQRTELSCKTSWGRKHRATGAGSASRGGLRRTAQYKPASTRRKEVDLNSLKASLVACSLPGSAASQAAVKQEPPPPRLADHGAGLDPTRSLSNSGKREKH